MSKCSTIDRPCQPSGHPRLKPATQTGDSNRLVVHVSNVRLFILKAADHAAEVIVNAPFAMALSCYSCVWLRLIPSAFFSILSPATIMTTNTVNMIRMGV